MKRALTIFVSAIMLSACSSTRILTEQQSRLVTNSIEVEGDITDPSTSKSTLARYLYQPVGLTLNGWNPLINIYNMTSGRGNGWDRFVETIGTAPTVYDSTKVSQSVENISTHLFYNGYYNNSVSSEVVTSKKKTWVTYKVDTGKRRYISEINFVLPSSGSLATDFIASRDEFTVEKGSPLSEALLETAADRITLALRNKGYYGLTKNYLYFEADTLQRPDSAALKVTVGSYTRFESAQDSVSHAIYRFGDVTISYPDTFKFDDEFLGEINLIRSGDIYNEIAVNNTYNRFGSVGVFSRVNVNLFPDAAKKTVETKIELSPSKLQGFKVNLEASSNSTGLFGISPQLSYFHKNVFHGGERLSVGFIGNYQFRFGEPTIRSSENGVNAAIDIPRFVFLPVRFFKMEIPHTLISASYNRQERPEYTRNIISTTYSYKGVAGRKRRLSYVASPIYLNIVNLYDIDAEFFKSISVNPFLKNAYQNHFDLGSGLDLYYAESSESPFYVRNTVDLAGNVLSLFNPLFPKDESGASTIWNTPYSQYVRLEVNVGKTWRLGSEQKLSFATRAVAGAGLAYGNSSALPFEKHFWAGGASSLRGFQSRTIGPGRGQRNTTFLIPNQTGDMKLEINAELRYPLFWKLEGATFIDAGNVWTINSHGDDAALTDFNIDSFIESTALCGGMGLRVNLNFIILRLDLGWPLYHPAGFGNGEHWLWKANSLTRGIATPVLQFGIGYPF